MRRTIVTILAGLAIVCVVAVIDVTLLGGSGKVRRGIGTSVSVGDCVTSKCPRSRRPRARLRRLMRPFLIALLALALLAPTAVAGDPSQHPPKMPNSTKGSKKCKNAGRFGASFRVFVVKGKGRMSCKRARKIVSTTPIDAVKHYQYFDWTKGGNGPWSDVYYRHDHKVIIGALLRDV